MPFRPSPLDASRAGPDRWSRRGWIAPTALALLPGLVFLPAALLRRVFAFGDVQCYFYPYHVLPAALLKQGELPLWNPYAFSGIPLLADGQTALFYPPNWLFLLLPGGAALNYDILIQFSIAGVGMYLLLRALELWRLPAFLGAAAYMLCGCVTARIVHLSILSGAALMPLALFCVDSAFREGWGPARGRAAGRPGLSGPLETDVPGSAAGPVSGKSTRTRWFVASAAVIGLQASAGHPQVPVYTALAIGLYALLRAIERWRAMGTPSSLYRLPAVVAGVYLLGGGLAAIQLLPWAELSALSTRAAGISFDLVFSTSMNRSEWLLQLFPYLYGPLSPGLFGDQHIALSLTGRFIEHSAYVGMLPLGLAGYALFGLRFRRTAGGSDRSASCSVLYLALLATLGLLLALGWATPLAQVVYRTPFVGRLRAVERALLLVDFGGAGLAAFGLQRLIEPGLYRIGAPRWSLAAIGTGLAALPVAALLLAPQPWFQRAMNLPPEAVMNLRVQRPNASVPLLLAFTSAALFLWWTRRPATRVSQALAVGLALLDLGVYAATYYPTAEMRFYDQRPDALAVFADEPRPFRKATLLPRYDPYNRVPRATLAMSWGLVHRVEDINGFNSLQPRRYTDYLVGPEAGDVSYGLLGDERLLRPDSPVLSSLNVRYVLLQAASPLRVGAGLQRVHADADVVVYENTRAYPRAFFAETVQSQMDPAEVLKKVTADGFDGRKLALVETTQDLRLRADAAQDKVAITAWKPVRIDLATATATPRLLVLSEMHFPGWQATVDGAATPIYRTNYLFRGVVVPAGRHSVVFSYRPQSVMIGAGISGLALVVALTILFAGWRPR